MTATMMHSDSPNPQMSLVGDQMSDDEYAKLCHQLAADFVENIIKFASNEAAILLNKPHQKQKPSTSRPSNLTPAIQIDLAGSRSPSPEEETFPWVKAARNQQSNDSYEDTRANTSKANNIPPIKPEPPADTQEPLKEDRQMTEIHQFAMAYVRDIISKAIVLASERESTFTSLKSEVSQPRIAPSNLSWMERIRQFFRRFITRACLCKTKHNSLDSFRVA